MRILLTGHTGYIGSHLLKSLRSLSDEFDIFVWDKNLGDLLDMERFAKALEKIKPDIAVLCAWQTTRTLNYEFDPKHHSWPSILEWQVNLSKAHNVFPVVFGSVADSFTCVESAYAQSKALLRFKLRELIDVGEISYLRLHYVLDEVDERPRIVKHVRDSIKKNINFFPNDPKGYVDYIHIDDVIAAIHLVICNRISGVVNICSGVERNAFSIAKVEYLRSERTYRDSHRAKSRISQLSVPHPSLIRLNWWPERTSHYFKGAI